MQNENYTMPRTSSITADTTDFSNTLTKALQSCQINFLLGSGASSPAIPIAGQIEDELNKLLEEPVALQAKKFGFLRGIQTSTNDLIASVANANNVETLDAYRQFLGILARILEERKTDLLPRQATVFTTNYDLFVERASESVATLRVNDGFLRGPTVGAKPKYQPEIFFDVTYKTGTLYRYTAAVPIVNLIKLHGSLSWRTAGTDLVYCAEACVVPDPGAGDFATSLPLFLDQFSLVLPTKEKFKQTLIERTYYDLLRTLANSLEVENTVLIAFGFSFEDEHIRDLITKALKNPTLLLVIVAYSSGSVDGYKRKFANHNNVVIYHPDGEELIKFPRFNELLSGIVPKAAYGN